MDPQHARRRLWRLLAADRVLRFGPVAESPRYSRRCELTEALQVAGGLTEPRDPDPLPEVDAADLDHAGFMEASDHLRRSVVIRGLGRDSRAVTQWTADYLRERLAEHRFTFVGGTPDPKRAPTDTRWDAEEMTFGRFLERMPHEPIYLNNDSLFAQACPELIDDLELERVRDRFNDPTTDWDELISTQVFISSALAYSPLHAAQSGNFFLQIRGRKTWTLVEPRHSLLLFPILARPALYAVSHYGGWREVADDHVLFAIPRYEVTLQPGDLLYNAPWWWHEVTNETDAGDIAIGCAFRHMPPPFRPSPSWQTQPQLTALSTYHLGRMVCYLHHAVQRLFGLKQTMRDFMNPVLSRRVHKSQ